MTDQILLTPGSAEDHSTPPYQTSAYIPHPSSTSSHPDIGGIAPRKSSSGNRHEAFETQKSHVEGYRERVTLCRTQVRELRDIGRADREDLWELQNRLHRELNKYLEGQEGSDKAALDRLREETEEAFERLGPNEVAYNEAEDDLRILEFKLERQETQFYSQTRTRRSISRGDAGAGAVTPPWYSSSPKSNLSSGDLQNRSPRAQYRIHRAEARIASDRLQELENEKSQLLDFGKDTGLTGLQLEPADAEFLASWDTRYEEQYKELVALQEHLAVLRLEIGSAISSENENTESLTNPDSPLQTPRSFPGRNINSSQHIFASLRRQSEGNHVPVDSRTTRQRVNQWILEVLQASPVQRKMSEDFLRDPRLSNRTWLHFIVRFRRINSLVTLDDEHGAFPDHTYLSDESEPSSAVTYEPPESIPDELPSVVDWGSKEFMQTDFDIGEQ